jgi:hypothetical protein
MIAGAYSTTTLFAQLKQQDEASRSKRARTAAQK